MTVHSVMVVEDNAITRKVMRLALEEAGFEVVEAADGATALARAANAGPDLVIQDMRLPDISGFDLLERLRALPGLADIPIIAVTGSMPERGPMTAPFTDVLIKPVEPSRLVRAVKTLLLAQHRVEPVPLEVRRRALVADDDVVQRKVVRLRLTEWGFEVTEAANGAEALRLARSSPPDLIVSDLLMPELDGLGFCREVRADVALCSVPFVLITSYHLDEVDRDLAASSGATSVVARSPDLADLQQAVVTIARRDGHASSPALAVPRAATKDVSRRVRQMSREASVRETLQRTEAAHAALLPFFARFSSLGSIDRAAAVDLQATVEELLERYLDASGTGFGCAFLVTPDGLTLRSHLGYKDAAMAGLPTFFGRVDLLEQTLAGGESIQLPSPGFTGADIEALLEELDTASMILVPLIIGGERLGILVLSADGSHSKTQRLRTVEAVRGPFAQALALSHRTAELVMSREAFRGIVDSSLEGIIVADAAGVVSYVNPPALEMFGFRADELLGKALGELVSFIGDGTEGSGSTIRKDGTTFSSSVRVTAVEDRPGHMLRVCRVRDLSQRETLERLALLANCDGLTGLFNRRRFEEHMAERLAEAIRYKTAGALVILDLDGFKAINDTHGHPAGDTVLKAVAEVLRANTRRTDFIARLGGDEFVVELPHVEVADAVAIATKLLAAIGAAIEWRDRSLHVGASAGIALYPADGETPERVLEVADAALYRSKRGGRNRVTATSGSGGV